MSAASGFRVGRLIVIETGSSAGDWDREAGRLALWAEGAGPHIHSQHSDRQIVAAWTLAAGLVACCGVVLFGFAALQVIVLAVAAAAASEGLLSLVTLERSGIGARHAALTGLLVGLTLPATVPWYVPCVASFAAVVPATWMFGGFGHCLWQPAVVGRVLAQFLFAGMLSTASGPVLAPGRLLVGSVTDANGIDAIAPGQYRGWAETIRGPRTEAFGIERPLATLRRMASGGWATGTDAAMTTMLRDYLPPWEDTVVGTVPGGIGESCTIALVVVGLYLVYRGYLRWQIPVFGIAAAGIAAAVLPIRLPTAAGPAEVMWLPGLIVERGWPVGAVYVMFCLTSGGLMLGLFLLAGDVLSRPLTARGQAVFGAGIGGLTIAMQLYGPAETAAYWAILIMNTFVPLIDRMTRRRPLGSGYGRGASWGRTTRLTREPSRQVTS